MDLHGHAGPQTALRKEPGNVDHGHLDQVGSRSLDRSVDGRPLGELPHGGRTVVDLRQIAPAAKERCHVSVAARAFQDAVEVAPHAPVLLEVPVDIGLGQLLGDVQFLGQAEGAHPVKDAEVDHLGLPAHLGVDHGGKDAEDVRSRPAVDVLAGTEGLDQGAVAGEVGQHPQFDLRVVRRDDAPARRRDEGLPDALPFQGADRDVLQVGVAAGQPPGGRHRLVVGCVHPSRLAADQEGQRVDVGGLEFGHAAIGQDFGRQFVLFGQPGKDIDVGRVSVLRLSALRKPHLLEQNDL